MKADKMKETIDRYYEQIEVPADLEARLSAAIDALAAEEAAAALDADRQVLRQLHLRLGHGDAVDQALAVELGRGDRGATAVRQAGGDDDGVVAGDGDAGAFV